MPIGYAAGHTAAALVQLVSRLAIAFRSGKWLRPIDPVNGAYSLGSKEGRRSRRANAQSTAQVEQPGIYRIPGGDTPSKILLNSGRDDPPIISRSDRRAA